MSRTTAVMGFRCPAPIAAALTQAANSQVRAKSKQVLRYVIEGLQRDGFLPVPADRASDAADAA
jgi:hypothetical protein